MNMNWGGHTQEEDDIPLFGGVCVSPHQPPSIPVERCHAAEQGEQVGNQSCGRDGRALLQCWRRLAGGRGAGAATAAASLDSGQLGGLWAGAGIPGLLTLTCGLEPTAAGSIHSAQPRWAQAGLLVLAWSCPAGPPPLLIGARQPYPRWAQCATPAVLWFCEAKRSETLARLEILRKSLGCVPICSGVAAPRGPLGAGVEGGSDCCFEV
ncbi:unnamed protein product [Boreogadus saida]